MSLTTKKDIMVIGIVTIPQGTNISDVIESELTEKLGIAYMITTAPEHLEPLEKYIPNDLKPLLAAICFVYPNNKNSKKYPN